VLTFQVKGPLVNAFIGNTPAAIPKFFSNCAYDPRSYPLPLADPGAPTVKSKRNESSTGYEFASLRLTRCGLHAGSEIIVDHKPTTVGQQITIAIQVRRTLSSASKMKSPTSPWANICRMADIVVSWKE
jgi:hypothetical protein